MEIRLRHPNPTQTTVQVVGDPTEPPAFGSRVIVPTSNYVFDPASGLWIPQVAGPGGTVVEYNSYRIADLISALLTAAEEGHDELLGAGAELRKLVAGIGLKDVDTARLVISALGYRKVVGIDEGAYVSPVPPSATVAFTGVNLLGRVLLVWNDTERKLHWITSVVDPVGATPGTLTLDPPIQAAAASLRIPFASIPHGFDLLADGWRNNQLNPPQNHVLGPNDLLAGAYTDNGGVVVDTVAPVGNFAIWTLHLYWLCAGAETYQWDLIGRGNADVATPDWVVLGAAWVDVSGTALGAPAITGTTIIRTNGRTKLYEVGLRRTKGGGNTAATIRLRIHAGY
ncbi:MAG: hypothetical protein ABIG85_03325 [Chloroflexota bacterium]